MTICSEDVIKHLTDLGYNDAVNEINKLLNKDKAQNERWRKYWDRINEFAKNFGAWSIGYNIRHIDLEYEIYGFCPNLRELAKNINGSYYESPDEDVCAEFGDELGNTITVNTNWFELIMHLWINKYSDYDYDIHQSKLRFD